MTKDIEELIEKQNILLKSKMYIIYGSSSQTMSATSIMMTIEHFKLYLHHHSKSQRVLCDVTLATFA